MVKLVLVEIGFVVLTKGHLISKAIYGLLTSSKKQTDKFVLFAFLLFTVNKSNFSVFLGGESTARQSAFQFYLTFSRSKYLRFFCCNCTLKVRHTMKKELNVNRKVCQIISGKFFLA